MSSSPPTVPIARVLRDPWLWVVPAVGSVFLAVTFLPVLARQSVDRINQLHSDPVLLLLLIPSLLIGLRDVPRRGERLFWWFLAIGLGSFLVAELIDFVPADSRLVSWNRPLRTTLFVGLYVFVAMALELKSHSGPADADRWRWRRRLETTGVVILAFGLLAYFSLLPELQPLERIGSAAATSLLYAVFDAYLVLRATLLHALTRRREWSLVYGLLALVFALWFAADLAEAAYWAGFLSDRVSALLLDLLWLPPFVGLTLAARWHRAVARSERAETSVEEVGEDRSSWALWRRPLWLQAMVLPAVHFGLESFGALDRSVASDQKTCAIVVFLVLAAMAVYDQKRLETVSRELEGEMQRAREAELRAHHDALTGLPNRFLLLDHLGLALAQARREENRVAVVYLDLDRFAVVNASLGHVGGDGVLQAVASRLHSAVRESDTLGRMGGDEFVLVAPGLREPADAQAVVAKLLAELRRPFSVEGVEMYVSLSAGVAIFPEDGQSSDDLLRRADRSMMRAKEQGGDRALRAEFQVDSGEFPELDLETALRKAVEERGFRLLYQPIFELGSGRVSACEALLRWEHPVHGLLRPADFLDTAESIGVMSRLTPWLLTNACRTASYWSSNGETPISVAVNLSARQFLDPALPRYVELALAESRLDGHRLQLEITESVAMAQPERMAHVLAGIRDLGVTIAVDDFGTGYSSLASLRALPIDTLKIDASFVRGIHDSSSGAAIVTTVLAMAGALGLNAVAEGVERPDELAALRALGCRFAQGYVLARPTGPNELGELLSRPFPAELRG